jgi:hypothetical protein
MPLKKKNAEKHNAQLEFGFPKNRAPGASIRQKIEERVARAKSEGKKAFSVLAKRPKQLELLGNEKAEASKKAVDLAVEIAATKRAMEKGFHNEGPEWRQEIRLLERELEKVRETKTATRGMIRRQIVTEIKKLNSEARKTGEQISMLRNMQKSSSRNAEIRELEKRLSRIKENISCLKDAAGYCGIILKPRSAKR